EHRGRAPRGDPFTGTHFPSCPATLHAWHCPVHGDSQQTPSTQEPDPHSSSVLHVVPSTLAHVPAFAGSEHDFEGPHESEAQQTPSVQKSAASHGVSAAHG